MSDTYPRVLVIGTTFNLENGGGITLSNLFRDWPSENLAVACAREHFVDTDKAKHFYRLGALEDRWVWPLGCIPREGKVSGPVAPIGGGEEPSSARSRSPGALRRLARAIFHIAVDVAGAEPLARRLRPSAALVDWIRGFHPHLIYSQLSNLGLIELVLEITEAEGLPVVLHFMDDWPAVIYRQGLLGPLVRLRMQRELGELVSRASAALGISQSMCEAFEKRYGKPFLPFHNAVELPNWLEFQKRSWTPHSPFRLMYRGRIGMALRRCLLDACRVVAKLNSPSERISFEIVTPDLDEAERLRLRRFAGTTVRGPISYSHVPQEMAQADALLLPLDFDKASYLYARYSMPTKAVEYMASGAPSLVYGPRDSAVARYAQEGGWGCVVSQQSSTALTSALLDLMRHEGTRERLGLTGIRLAASHHDASVVREEFRRVLVEACRCSWTRRVCNSLSGG